MQEMVDRLDDFGKPAWIAVMVLGFVVFWPVGLAILAYLLWSGRMTCGWHSGRSRWQGRFADKWAADKWNRACSRVEEEVRTFASGGGSGNKAFDEYREATLKRLEEEERDFRTFLDKLRQAKDKAEFDQFMSERRNTPPAPSSGPSVPQV